MNGRAVRAVRFDKSCDDAVEQIGGYESVDESLDAYLDGLHRNPEGFGFIATDWGGVRYIRTRQIGDIPELLWYFVIETNGDVAIVHVEFYEFG